VSSLALCGRCNLLRTSADLTSIDPAEKMWLFS
jgi:hypothetical protein